MCEPGILPALDRGFFVIHEVVPQDTGARGVGGRDVAAAVNDALSLIKVHSFDYIVGDDGIVLPDFGHAIDLHG